jgi:hypothetical protein
MPTYLIRNNETDEHYEEYCSWSELQEFLKKNPKYEQVPQAPAIVSSVASGLKNDSGWNDNMQRIADAHPDSPLADRYRRKTTKEVKTQQVLKKHGLIG